MALPTSRQLSAGRAVVLLVECDDDNREMYAQYLRQCGFAVQTAGTTDEGLRRARNADVIVTEIRVPGSCDGVGLVCELRNATETQRTPIIVLTACAFETDRQRARAAGCNVFLPKPCLPDHLVSEIRAIGQDGSDFGPHRASMRQQMSSALPSCPKCQAPNPVVAKPMGSAIRWLTCRLCGHVWCATLSRQEA
jgi:two-component system, cell cycle response regulator DivK